MARLGVDVGGTFTDLVLVRDDGSVFINKLPTTPSDPSVATVAGALELCRRAGVSPADVSQFLHGTTVATNSVLQYEGAEVGLITTKGFRDILHTARHRRPLTFSAYQSVPWQERPLIKRRHRHVVAERVVPPDGEVTMPLDEEAVRTAARELRAAGVHSIAICFLFSFLNPEHEIRAREIVVKECPEAYVYLRSEVAPRYREYEAFSTVALSAFVGPAVARYIRALDGALAANGFGSRLHLMTSAGGVATADGAASVPASLLLSGPVGGLIGGLWAARAAGFAAAITLDVGGTSADIGVAPGGEVRRRHLLDTQIGGYHSSLPMADIDTIGAGGGSVAYVDNTGMFHVGPHSAGAEPGPACYGRGGKQATGTDAMVVLGRIAGDSLLGGSMQVRDDLAREAVKNQVADPLGIEVDAAASAIVGVLVHNMIQAIELNSVQQGYDPRDFALVALGGGGPLFACDIAQELGIPSVIIPPHPGITSAVGLLASDARYDFASTVMTPIDGCDTARIEADWQALDSKAVQQLQQDGLEIDRINLRRTADCRYIGQGYELPVGVPAGLVNDEWLAAVEASFHAEHERIYSRRLPGPVMIVTINTEAFGAMPAFSLQRLDAGTGDAANASVGIRRVGFGSGEALQWYDTPVFDRSRLLAGDAIDGPAIVAQFDTTTVINPGVRALVHATGSIVLDVSGATSAGRETARGTLAVKEG